jgi:hypothetical protein
VSRRHQCNFADLIAQGRGFDVEEYAERIYRANINLGLAEVPRDYFDSAQAPDFWH